MTTFLLVHGAWHGAWCWADVAAGLRAAGHDVVTPTLVGLGERAGELTPHIDLATHVDDVVTALPDGDVVLVAHSYAGLLVPAVVTRASGRVARAVVVDGFLPYAGEIPVDLLPEAAAAHYRDAAREHGDGWRIPPRPLANLGVRDTGVVARVAGRLTDHPLRTYTEAVAVGIETMSGPAQLALCVDWPSPFTRFTGRAAERGWTVGRLPADHEIMLTDPGRLVDHLLRGPG